MKEPSFFFAAEPPTGPVLRKCVVLGNHNRGSGWYDGLFDSRNGIRTDFSTQYWLHLDQVVERSSHLSVRFVVIDRNPVEQIVSYVTHLRRGYIPDRSISQLVEEDPSFLAYLDSMVEFARGYAALQERLASKLTVLDFQSLIADPSTHISDRLGIGIDSGANEGPVNPSSYPRLGKVNNLLFSEPVRRVGRRMPQSLYSRLINLRKMAVSLNLTSGEGTQATSDRKFLEERYGRDASA